MGREFKPDKFHKWVARWMWEGSVEVDRHGVGQDEIPAFIEWLQAGPPKKRYRITRTFDFRPVHVMGEIPATSIYHNARLRDADIEEAWE